MSGRTDVKYSADWLELLTNGHAAVRLSHRLFRRVPGSPRCKLCHNPFGGFAGRAMAKIGCTPSRLNPNFCTRCCDKLPKGGAKVDVAVLFADIRGSTSLGEHAAPAEYADLLNRFYRTATHVLIAHDAIIDKIIGDEVMALFVQGFAGKDYRMQTGAPLSTGCSAPSAGWVPTTRPAGAWPRWCGRSRAARPASRPRRRRWPPPARRRGAP